MKKFEALYNMTALVVPFIVKSDTGAIIRDQTIVFNQGSTTKQGTTPASLMTNDPEVIKYLQAYGGNEANGGISFREVVEKKSEVKAEKSAPKEIAPEPPKEEGTEAGTDIGEGESNAYLEATTVQAAGNILKGLFEELTSRDVNNKEKVLAVAASKNISFPNLK
jgi:hypothetical protein